MPTSACPERDGISDFSGATREDLAHLYFAVIVLTAGALLACMAVYSLRSGLVGSPAQVSGMFALMILPLWTTAWGAKRFGATSLGFSTAILSGFFFGVMLPAAALIFGRYALAACLIVLALTMMDSGKELLAVLNRNKASILMWTVTSSILLVVLTETIRLYLPEAVILGIAPPGAYYNIALAQMIERYGAVSLGMDGLAYRHYHFLTHVIAAGFAKATGANMSLVYVYWGGLAVKIQLLWATVSAGVFLLRAQGARAAGSSARLAYAWICVAFVGGFTGETFGIGTALLFTMVPALACLATADVRDKKNHLPATILAIAATFLVTVAKVSSGFFAAIALVLVLWRVRRSPAVAALIALSLAVLTAVTLRYIAEWDLSDRGYPLIAKFADYMHYYTWNTFFNYALAISVMVLLMSVGHVKIRSRKLEFSMSFGQRLKPGRQGEPFIKLLWNWLSNADFLVQFLALSILGCIFVLFSTRIGANNGYFSWTIYGLGFLLLPLAIQRAFSNANFRPVTRPLSLIVAAILLCQGMSFVIADGAGLPQVITSLFRKSIADYKPRRTQAEMRASLARDGTLFGGLRRHVDAWPVASTMNDIAKFAAAGDLVVNITPMADDVWAATDKTLPTWCVTGQLVVPAIAGIAQVRSIPPQATEDQCVLPGTLPAQGFGLEQSAHRTGNFTDAQLCEMARPLGARRVYKLTSYADPTKNKLVPCR
jgi:hypothetical protein